MRQRLEGIQSPPPRGHEIPTGMQARNGEWYRKFCEWLERCLLSWSLLELDGTLGLLLGVVNVSEAKLI
jgi:hypothetical protein